MNPPSDAERVAAAAARILLDIDAVLIRADEPFTLTSGRLSPVYVDCRRIISFPRARRRLMAFAEERLEAVAGVEAFDAVAGGETAGIPFAAWLADRLNLPMLYVRKQPKGFGRNARIEGVVEPSARVLLVEDLATDGGSKIGFVEALREAGAEVAHIIVVFRYGVFAQGEQHLRDMGCALHGLTSWADVLRVAEAEGRIGEDTANQVRAFLEDPDGWAASRAG